MFKKLKDKIAEEVKQSPLRLPTSVQQHLSQVMILNRFLRFRYNKIFAAFAYWLLIKKYIFTVKILRALSCKPS
jgi:hypothetical protein